LGNTAQQTKNTPKKLGILWDVSHSAAKADKEKDDGMITHPVIPKNNVNGRWCVAKR